MIMQRAHSVAAFVFLGVMASPAFAQTRGDACGEIVLHDGRTRLASVTVGSAPPRP